MRGRKPQPKQGAIKSLKPGFPKAPSDLSKAAKDEWVRLKSVMGSQLIGNLDLAVLRVYCEDVATFLEAKAEIVKGGKIIYGPKGHPMENPWLWIMERAKKGLLKAAAELGLTPVARTRVAAEEPESSDDSIESFMGSAPLRLAK